MTALDATIADHRHLYRQDLHISRLVARQPPTTLDLNTGQLHVEPGAATGMNMSGRLLRYLGHPEGYGGEFQWSKGLWRVRYWCRREHPFHRAADRPYWRGSLCHQLVSFVIVREFSVYSAATVLKYDNPEPVLRAALQYIESAIDGERRKAEKRLREDAGRGDGAIPVQRPAHHSVPGLHQAECPQCKRNAA